MQKLLTLKQVVAEFPWITERRVRQLVAERRITYYKDGRKLLFDPADIERLPEQVEAAAG